MTDDQISPTELAFGQLITLDDQRQWAVAGVLKKEEQTYAYLIDDVGLSDLQICLVKTDDQQRLILTPITEPSLLQELFKEFQEQISRELGSDPELNLGLMTKVGQIFSSDSAKKEE